MISRVTDYPGYLIRFSADSPTQNAILLFHGFPATRGVKNLDLADFLHRKFQCDVYLLHYKGLGESPGTFRFTDSIAEAAQVTEFLTQKGRHQKLSLVGHSWGGMICLNVLHQCAERISSVVLLSPFCDLNKSDSLHEWFVNGVKAELKHIFGGQSEQEIAQDFEKVVLHHLPKVLVPQLPRKTPISIIQASQDDVTPPSIVKQLLPRFSVPPRYRELDMDHSFTQDRRVLAEAIAEVIQI